MFDASPIDATLSTEELYASIEAQLSGLITGESDVIANLANAASLLIHSLPDLNWVGFYLLKDGELVLGPFQGRPACVRIPLGRGVCGTAAQKQTMLRVADVNEFPGHIACDSASRSELVAPIIDSTGALRGVLDLDSPRVDRFGPEDEAGVRRLAEILAGRLSSTG